MATKKHSLVTIAARHPVVQLSYADAANRIAGTNEQSGITVSATNIHSIAHQRDDDSFWVLMGVGPIVWGQILSYNGGDYVILPDAGNITIIGDASAATFVFTNDDLLVTGMLEVVDDSYFSGLINARDGIRLRDLSGLRFGTSDDSGFFYATGQTNDTLMNYLSADSKSLIICDKDDTGTDYAHGLQPNPTYFWHSSDETDITQWGSVSHDQTDFVIDQGKGTTKLAGGVKHNVTTVNAATYDLLVSDYILHVTYTTTGAVTSLTLPTAQTEAGRTIIIKDAGLNAGTFNITIDTEGGELIDGLPTYTISSNAESVTLYSDGTDWFSI